MLDGDRRTRLAALGSVAGCEDVGRGRFDVLAAVLEEALAGVPESTDGADAGEGTADGRAEASRLGKPEVEMGGRVKPEDAVWLSNPRRGAIWRCVGGGGGCEGVRYAEVVPETGADLSRWGMDRAASEDAMGELRPRGR